MRSTSAMWRIRPSSDNVDDSTDRRAKGRAKPAAFQFQRRPLPPQEAEKRARLVAAKGWLRPRIRFWFAHRHILLGAGWRCQVLGNGTYAPSPTGRPHRRRTVEQRARFVPVALRCGHRERPFDSR